MKKNNFLKSKKNLNGSIFSEKKKYISTYPQQAIDNFMTGFS